MNKKDIYINFGFKKDGNTFVYDKAWEEAVISYIPWKHTFSDDKNEVERFTIKDFNFLGIKELENITFVIPQRTFDKRHFCIRGLNEDVLYSEFFHRTISDGESYNWCNGRMFWHVFVKYFIGDILLENGIEYETCNSNGRDVRIFSPLDAILENKDKVSLFIGHGILTFSFEKMFALWTQIKQKVCEQAKDRELYNFNSFYFDELEMSAFKQIFPSFTEGMLECDSNEDIERYINNFKENHIRFGKNGEGFVYFGEKAFLYHTKWQDENRYVSISDFNTNTGSLSVFFYIPERTYEWSSDDTKFRILNKYMENFTDVEFNGNEEYTFVANMLSLSLIKLFKGRNIKTIYDDSKCEENIFSALADKKNLELDYHGHFYSIPLQDVCELWDDLKDSVRVSLYKYRAKEEIEKISNRLGIKTSFFKKMRNTIRKSDTGLEIASLLFEYKARTA